jgi:hypothetical protein
MFVLHASADRGRKRSTEHIDPFCAPQRMDAEIPDAAHNGGRYLRGRIEAQAGTSWLTLRETAS